MSCAAAACSNPSMNFDSRAGDEQLVEIFQKCEKERVRRQIAPFRYVARYVAPFGR